MSGSIREFSKECLLIALLKLMKEKNISDITIKELTDKAGISRSTFYRHYSLPIDILRDYLQPSFLKLIKVDPYLEGPVISRIYKENINTMYKYFSRNRELMTVMFQAGMTDFIRDAITGYLSHKFSTEWSACKCPRLQETIFIGLYIEVLTIWTKTNRIQHTEEMTNTLMDMVEVCRNIS